jgi:hypothetical protein
MNKKQYFERAEAEVRRAKQRLPEYAGDCALCRWSRVGFMEDRCAHPAVICAAFNVTDDYGRSRIQECAEQRDRDSPFGSVVCGPDGALFERRVSLRERLFGQSERTGA